MAHPVVPCAIIFAAAVILGIVNGIFRPWHSGSPPPLAATDAGRASEPEHDGAGGGYDLVTDLLVALAALAVIQILPLYILTAYEKRKEDQDNGNGNGVEDRKTPVLRTEVEGRSGLPAAQALICLRSILPG